MRLPSSHTTRHTGPYQGGSVELTGWRNLTKQRAFRWTYRCDRITPRPRSLRLHLGFPVKGQLDWWAGFRIGHKILLLLTTPYRSGLQCPAAPTMPFADSCCAIRADCSALSQFPWHATSQGTRQVSRGKFLRFRYTTAGFTRPGLDGYGLRDLTLSRPPLAPPIQFLFVGSHLCSTLPSDLTSR